MPIKEVDTVPEIPIEEKTKQLMDTLRAMGEGWHSRSAIADFLGKARLNATETTILEMLALDGRIERRLVPSEKPHMLQAEYHVKG